mgnify:CR=1 FL=1
MIKFSQYVTEDTTAALKKKAEKSGMPMGILRKVFNRGVAAWRTGHRPGTTPTQWGLARVNSFVTKSSGTWGKAVLRSLKKMVSPEAKKALAGAYWDGTAVVHNKTDETMGRMHLNMKLSGLAKEVEQWTKENVKPKGKKR